MASSFLSLRASPPRSVPVLFLIASALAVPGLAQSTIHVPADHPTIQAAIDAAVDGDLVLVGPGDYAEIDFRGKAITVRAEPLGEAAILSSFTAAVTFENGEGPDSRLIGFGISGRVSDKPSGGIYCARSPVPARPTIADCAIGNCDATWAIAEGIGVHGDATLVRCTIQSNHGETITIVGASHGGGVYGAPHMIECRISGNSAMSGGGLVLLSGAHLEDCQIIGNDGSVGFSQYGAIESYGGGILCSGSVLLERCVIAQNAMFGYVDFEGFQYGFGAGISGSPTLIDCTVVDNHLYYGAEVGGIHGFGQLTNCILRGNDGVQGGGAFAYCNTPGPPPGPGNFDADPLFVNTPREYRLQPGSPCIDTGDPLRLDPDSTRSDVGARWFNHHPPAQTIRLGADVNPLRLASDTAPVLGATWIGELSDPRNPQSFAGGRFAILQGRSAPGSAFTPFGELLLDLSSPRLVTQIRPLQGSRARFELAIPQQLDLLGLSLNLQAVRVARGLALSNALDLQVGIE